MFLASCWEARVPSSSHIYQEPTGHTLCCQGCDATSPTTPHSRVLRAICVPHVACPGPTTHLYHVQLGDAVLLHGHGQRNPIFLYNHLGVQAFPSMGKCVLGLLGEVP